MKKLSAIIIAMALVLGLGQCKKQETPTANNEEDMVYITVNVDDDGAKHTVYPSTGAYVFTEGDVLYVGNNGHFIGTLEYQSGAFSGGIQSPSTDDYLHFYFLGGKGPQAPEAGTESFTIDIADQSDNLPVLSYGPSTQKYTDANTTYSTTLRNKCALVEFTTNEIPVETAVSLSGMKTEATINFNDNTIAPTSTTGGLTLHAESATSHWAILLPGEEVTATASAEGYNSTTVTVPAVSNNGYLHGESAVIFGMTEAASAVSLATPLTMEALTDGTIEVYNPQTGMQYSLNGGEKTVIVIDWSNTFSFFIDVTAGDKVAFYGNGTSIYSYWEDLEYSTHLADGTATVKVYGNIMSLVDETGFETATSLGVCAFRNLFSGNSTLVDASDLLLPATMLDGYCYSNMFANCTSLAAAPELPATTLDEGCYAAMFANCTSLTTAPALPAMILSMDCYQSMFSGCTSLTTAPVLPVTTLSLSCYSYMFSGCTSLTTAPVLPATILDLSCYDSMFSGCTSLTTAPELPATTLEMGCYRSMFEGCTSLTTAPELPATILADGGYDHDGCYREMFANCTSLTTVPTLPATTLTEDCYYKMFSGCTSLTTAPTLPATTLAASCYYGMFSGCTSLTAAPTLPATTLAGSCYREMFKDCTNLTTAPSLPATTLTSQCYQDMFLNCTSLQTPPTLPATVLEARCYSGMFKDCTGLTTAPTLPATTLLSRCYEYMFYGCSNLSSVTCLATSGFNYSHTNHWLQNAGTSALGTKTFYAVSSTYWPTEDSGIPSGWTRVNIQ